ECYTLSLHDALPISELEVMALESSDLMSLFEETARASGNPKAAFNWISGEVTRKRNALGERFDRARVSAAALATLIQMVERGTRSEEHTSELQSLAY